MDCCSFSNIVYSIFSVVQLQTSRCGTIVASSFSLGRCLLVWNNDFCNLWGIYCFSSSYVLSEVINIQQLSHKSLSHYEKRTFYIWEMGNPLMTYVWHFSIAEVSSVNTQEWQEWWGQLLSAPVSWPASRSPAWCRSSSPPRLSTGNFRHSGLPTTRTSYFFKK